jgi:hypothetical protein
MANGVPYGAALTQMLALLDDFVPPGSPPLPDAALSVASLSERAVGLGGLRGLEFRDRFQTAELKAVRLDALVRYELWGDSPAAAAQAAGGVGAGLLGARTDLGRNGVLKLALESVDPPDFAASADAWRVAANYRVLYEFPYQDAEGAESIIARIPVDLEPEDPSAAPTEQMLLTDELARWDDDAAPALVVRGPFAVGALHTLTHVSGAPPTGTVTLARTFDGATADDLALPPTLDGFVDAVTGASPARNARLSFASLDAFLAELGPAGDPVVLGDWDEDGAPDVFLPRSLAILPPLHLPAGTDRFEISYGDAALDRPAVAYLRATRG